MTFMLELIQSQTFQRWLNGLKDRQARARVQARLDRLALGNPGDTKPLRDGVSELRIDYGPGRLPGVLHAARAGDRRAARWR